MKAFLTLWDPDKDLRRTQIVDCYKICVYDGAEIDVDGDKVLLFNVKAETEIIPHVASVEIL